MSAYRPCLGLYILFTTEATGGAGAANLWAKRVKAAKSTSILIHSTPNLNDTPPNPVREPPNRFGEFRETLDGMSSGFGVFYMNNSSHTTPRIPASRFSILRGNMSLF